MPKGYTFQVFKRLCAQRERYRRGLLNEQTMDSLRLRFGRWLFEHGVVNEGEETEHVSTLDRQPGLPDNLVASDGPCL